MTLGHGMLGPVTDPSLTRADTAAFVGRYKEAETLLPSYALSAGGDAPPAASAPWTPSLAPLLNSPAAGPACPVLRSWSEPRSPAPLASSPAQGLQPASLPPTASGLQCNQYLFIYFIFVVLYSANMARGHQSASQYDKSINRRA